MEAQTEDTLSLQDEADIFLEGFRYGERCPFCGHDSYHYVDVGVGGIGVPVAVTCCDHGIALYQYHDEGLARAAATIAEARWLIERLTKHVTPPTP